MKRDAATKDPATARAHDIINAHFPLYEGTRMNYRTQYDDERDAHERKLTDFMPEGESKTVQSQAEDADINVIIKRMGLMGIMPEPLDISFYQDASNLPDLRAVLEYVS